MKMIERTCWCGKKFQARKVDVKRGYGNSCCKSHASIARERKLDRFGFQSGEGGTFRARKDGLPEHESLDSDYTAGMDCAESGWDGHKSN